jgi:hypothetical protein
MSLGSSLKAFRALQQTCWLTIAVVNVIHGLPSLSFLVEDLSRVCRQVWQRGSQDYEVGPPSAHVRARANNTPLTKLPVEGSNALDLGPHIIVLKQGGKMVKKSPGSLVARLSAYSPVAHSQMRALALMGQLCLHGPYVLVGSLRPVKLRRL